MKAARLYAREDLRVEEPPEPVVGPGEVKLRNAYAGSAGPTFMSTSIPSWSAGARNHTR